MTGEEIVKAIWGDADRLFTESGGHCTVPNVEWDTSDGLTVLVSFPMLAELMKHLNTMSRVGSTWDMQGMNQLVFNLFGGQAQVHGVPATLCNTVIVDRPRLVTGLRYRTQLPIRDLVLADYDLARHLYKEVPAVPSVWLDQSDPDCANLSTRLKPSDVHFTTTNVLPKNMRVLLWYSEFGLHRPEVWKPKERTPADIEQDELRALMMERRKKKGDC